MKSNNNTAKTKEESGIETSKKWTFLTNHMHVVLSLHRDKEITVRNLALNIGITERSVQRILNELVEAEVVTRQREGRCNVYSVDYEYRLRHELEKNHNIGDLLRLLKE